MKTKVISPIDNLCPLCKGSPRRHTPRGIKILCPRCGGSGRKITNIEYEGKGKKN